MRIATWNVECLKHIDKLDEMRNLCKDALADILILTETDSRLRPDYKYCVDTPPAKEAIPSLYADTENRVSIYTNYPIIRQHETYDKYIAICVELDTERGSFLVYGTIMGIFGNREQSYKGDLKKQMEDVKRLSKIGSICVAGDFNCTFSDYYFTTYGRDMVSNTFADADISILTRERPECIDHIAISNNYLGDAAINVSEWNLDKALSDHKGIVAEIRW